MRKKQRFNIREELSLVSKRCTLLEKALLRQEKLLKFAVSELVYLDYDSKDSVVTDLVYEIRKELERCVL